MKELWKVTGKMMLCTAILGLCTSNAIAAGNNFLLYNRQALFMIRKLKTNQ